MSISCQSPIFTVGLDVHKDSVTAAVFRDRDPEPLRVDRLPYDLKKIRRYFQRLQAEGSVRACYECRRHPHLGGFGTPSFAHLRV